MNLERYEWEFVMGASLDGVERAFTDGRFDVRDIEIEG